jgi:hypothetical protein
MNADEISRSPDSSENETGHLIKSYSFHSQEELYMMMLKDLTIRREPAWRIPISGEDVIYKTTITVDCQEGESTFNLHPSLSEKIIAIIADQIIENTIEVAEDMKRAVLDIAKPAITDQSDDQTNDV